MVRPYKERFGRGPTNSVTHFAGPDCIVSTLGNTFTLAERHLVASGEHQRRSDTRQAVKAAAETTSRATSSLSRPYFDAGRRNRGAANALLPPQDLAAPIESGKAHNTELNIVGLLSALLDEALQEGPAQVTSVIAPAATKLAAHRWSEFTHVLRKILTPSLS